MFCHSEIFLSYPFEELKIIDIMKIMDKNNPKGPSEPTQETSATQRAYMQLRRMLLVGELPPGEKLKIERLRGVLNTGGSPIREALSLLTSDLLVERLDQRGFRTAEISRENFSEILKLRCSLEEMALRESISNATEEWEETLVLAHHRLSRQPREDIEVFEDRHKHFHMALLRNCRSPVLLKFCNQLYDLNIRYRYLAGRSMDYSKRDVTKEHESIMNASIERNADLACRHLLDHYRNTGAFLEQYLSPVAAE